MRTALLLNVSSPVSAVLLFFPPAHRALCQRCPHRRSRTGLTFVQQHAPFLPVRLIPGLDVHLCPDPRAARSQFIPAYSHLQSLLLCVPHLKLRSSAISVLSFFFSGTKGAPSVILLIYRCEEFVADSSGSNQDRDSQLFYYFTHHSCTDLEL